jgi:hypothetical protein
VYTCKDNDQRDKNKVHSYEEMMAVNVGNQMKEDQLNDLKRAHSNLAGNGSESKKRSCGAFKIIKLQRLMSTSVMKRICN